MRMTRSACCARAVSGQATTPPRSVMNPRRLITDPEVSGRYRHKLAHWKRSMSALGQKRTFATQKVMSAYPRKRTFAVHSPMSAMGQKRTHAAQQTAAYSITSLAKASNLGGIV